MEASYHFDTYVALEICWMSGLCSVLFSKIFFLRTLVFVNLCFGRRDSSGSRTLENFLSPDRCILVRGFGKFAGAKVRRRVYFFALQRHVYGLFALE